MRQDKFDNGIIYNADCFDVFPLIPDKSVDMILCDLPYGTTACKWDTIIPFEPLWKEYKRVIKDNGAIVLTASQPFTSALVMSNPKMFKYCWVWNKKQSGNIGLARYQPLKITEDVLVFSKKTHRYFPEMRKGKMRIKGGSNKPNTIATGIKGGIGKMSDSYYPVNLIDFQNCSNKSQRVHPTQKPVALFEYLIKTYTNEGQTVLDNCAGSFTTSVACINTNREFICVEKDEDFGYYEIGKKRIEDRYLQLKQTKA